MIVPAGCIYGLNLNYLIILVKHGLASAHPWLLGAISIRTDAVGDIMVFILPHGLKLFTGF